LAPRAYRRAHAAEAQVLQVAQAAVQDLQAVRRRRAAEVAALDERRAITGLGRAARDPGAVHAAADDGHVELARAEHVEIARQVGGRAWRRSRLALDFYRCRRHHASASRAYADASLLRYTGSEYSRSAFARAAAPRRARS